MTPNETQEVLRDCNAAIQSIILKFEGLLKHISASIENDPELRLQLTPEVSALVELDALRAKLLESLTITEETEIYLCDMLAKTSGVAVPNAFFDKEASLFADVFDDQPKHPAKVSECPICSSLGLNGELKKSSGTALICNICETCFPLDAVPRPTGYRIWQH